MNARGSISACSHPRNFGLSRAPTARSSVTRPTRLEVSPTALETEIGSQHSTRLEPTQSGVYTCRYRATHEMIDIRTKLIWCGSADPLGVPAS
jgi:hypothetical protein